VSRIIITGGGGFLGSHLSRLFLDRDDQVVVVDNFSTGRYENIVELEDRRGFELVHADVCEEIPVAGAVDGVMHLASPASPPGYLARPLETMDVGSRGTRNALDLARANDARFLLASTSEIYGDPAVHPQREDYNGNVDPTGPRAVYDEAKRFAETLTMTYHRLYGTNTGIVRIFNTYGPRLRPADGRVVSNFLVQAAEGKPMTIHGDGTQTRSFCYVDDEVRGIAALYDSDILDPVNIGNPDEYTMLELADLVREVTQSTSDLVFEPLPEGDPAQRQPDITRARELLDWQPETPLREGLTRLHLWYEEERARDQA
jgi:nucleoside-diphosphate-sugar epimerase